MRQKLGKTKSQQRQETLKPGHLTIPTTSALPLSSDNQTTTSPQQFSMCTAEVVLNDSVQQPLSICCENFVSVNHKLFSIRTYCFRTCKARSHGFNSWQQPTFRFCFMHNIKSYLPPAEARCSMLTQIVTTTGIPIEALTWFAFTAHLHCTLSRCFGFCEIMCAT